MTGGETEVDVEENKEKTYGFKYILTVIMSNYCNICLFGSSYNTKENMFWVIVTMYKTQIDILSPCGQAAEHIEKTNREIGRHSNLTVCAYSCFVCYRAGRHWTHDCVLVRVCTLTTQLGCETGRERQRRYRHTEKDSETNTQSGRRRERRIDRRKNREGGTDGST